MPRKQKLPVPAEGHCIFCLVAEDDEDKFGKLLTKDGITVHYFCMLFASGLCQNGDDDEGFFGFKHRDIMNEFRRGTKLRCTYCKKTGATIGCIVGSCRIQYHYCCGFDNKALFHFFGSYSSHCRDHRPEQKGKLHCRSNTCSICLSTVSVDKYCRIKAVCCANGVFHRECIQRQATIAGLHFFKCALCNNKERFQEEMLQAGIYIPDKDADWELEPNAYSDLLERHDQCDIPQCICPDGRKANKLDTKFELMLCDACGHEGTHLACSGLSTPMDDWMCESCAHIHKKMGSMTPATTTPMSNGIGKPRGSLKCLTASTPGSAAAARSKQLDRSFSAKRKLSTSPWGDSFKKKACPSFSPPATSTTTTTSSMSKQQPDGAVYTEDQHGGGEGGGEGGGKKKRSSSGGKHPRLSMADRRLVELSSEALSVSTGFSLGPKPRTTRRSLQAGAPLTDKDSIINDEATPGWLKNLYKEDIHTGKNLGKKFQEVFCQKKDDVNINEANCMEAKPSIDECELPKQIRSGSKLSQAWTKQPEACKQEDDGSSVIHHYGIIIADDMCGVASSPTAARCRPRHHTRRSRGCTYWRSDSSPLTVRSLLSRRHRRGEDALVTAKALSFPPVTITLSPASTASVSPPSTPHSSTMEDTASLPSSCCDSPPPKKQPIQPHLYQPLITQRLKKLTDRTSPRRCSPRRSSLQNSPATKGVLIQCSPVRSAAQNSPLTTSSRNCSPLRSSAKHCSPLRSSSRHSSPLRSSSRHCSPLSKPMRSPIRNSPRRTPLAENTDSNQACFPSSPVNSSSKNGTTASNGGGSFKTHLPDCPPSLSSSRTGRGASRSQASTPDLHRSIPSRLRRTRSSKLRAYPEDSVSVLTNSTETHPPTDTEAETASNELASQKHSLHTDPPTDSDSVILLQPSDCEDGGDGPQHREDKQLSYEEFVVMYCTNMDNHDYVAKQAMYRQYLYERQSTWSASPPSSPIITHVEKSGDPVYYVVEHSESSQEEEDHNNSDIQFLGMVPPPTQLQPTV